MQPTRYVGHVAQDAEVHVIVVEQPLHEGLGDVRRRIGPPRADALHEVADRIGHVLEVLDGKEDGREQRVDLMLDAAQLLPRLDTLDPELAIQLARPVVGRPANSDDVLPLSADREDRMDRREDAQTLALKEVLETLEDTWRVGRVRLDYGHLVLVTAHAA
jgi:hypothetical protein